MSQDFLITCHLKRILSVISTIVICIHVISCNTDNEEGNPNLRYRIDGKVVVPFAIDQDWVGDTRVLVDGGEFLGFLKSDGSFSIQNLPSGSYVIEIANPTYAFEIARVDITSKGKMRARRVNNVQPSAVTQITYPLKFKARGKSTYFQQREQWRITDFLMNPMVMMMVLPFLMIMVLPKLVNTNDPEAQKEMQSQMNMLNPKQSMPDIAEFITSFLGTSTPKKPKAKPKPIKRRT